MKLWPTPTLLSGNSRTKHRKRYGLSDVQVHDEAKDVGQVDEDVQVVERKDAVCEEVVPEAPSALACVYVDNDLFAKDLVLLIVNHGIPWKSAELVTKLVNSYLLGRTLLEPLPCTAYQLKRLTDCRPGNARLLHVCPVCDFVFDDAQPVCAPCGLPPRLRVKRQLLVNDVSVMIKQMFAVPKLAHAMEYASTRRTGDGDVWDGRVMRGIPLGTRTHTFSINQYYL